MSFPFSTPFFSAPFLPLYSFCFHFISSALFLRPFLSHHSFCTIPFLPFLPLRSFCSVLFALCFVPFTDNLWDLITLVVFRSWTLGFNHPCIFVLDLWELITLVLYFVLDLWDLITLVFSFLAFGIWSPLYFRSWPLGSNHPCIFVLDLWDLITLVFSFFDFGSWSPLYCISFLTFGI